MLCFIYFAYVSKYIFLSVLIFLLLIAGSWTNMVDGGTRERRGRGRGRRRTRRTEEKEA
jgi:phosphatidylglycerophosphate synthase